MAEPADEDYRPVIWMIGFAYTLLFLGHAVENLIDSDVVMAFIWFGGAFFLLAMAIIVSRSIPQEGA